MLILFGLMVVNFAISVFNAWSVGRSWVETKAAGGWPRFMAWMGAVMSACGFTWVYLIILALIAQSFGKLPEVYVDAALKLGYLVIILPVLGSGLAITIQSWAHFWRERNLRSGAITGWNTFAQAYNMYEAASAIPDAVRDVYKVLGGKDKDDDDGKAKAAVLLIVILALTAGVLTTAAIIRVTARTRVEQTRRKFGPRTYR